MVWKLGGDAEGNVGGVAPQWELALSQPLQQQPVLDGVVVTAAWHGEVYGVDTKSGRRMWAVPTKDINSQPVVSGGLAHVYSWNGELTTIDTRTGRVTWTNTGVLDSLAADNGTLVTGSETEVASLDPGDGKARWTTKLKEKIVGSPALTKDTVFVSDKNGEVYALDLNTGTTRWSKPLLGISNDQGPVTAGNTVVVATGKQIVALDTGSGKELWRRDFVVAGRNLLAASGLLIFKNTAGDDEALTALDVSDGTQKWSRVRSKTGDARVDGYLSASADRLYVAYDSEKLCAHRITHGTLLNCFPGINDLPGSAATSDGVYVNSHNQRLYYLRKDSFG
ncbi:PQQ-binding-like beta-propeller repeat protein [Streptomyces sp. 147326]|uniref:outer membrane protein assembly factor BamB family protein n=1 Tax=Streptomyces sp. 147326 TaxID=3074379 RepID=UPI003857B925